MKWFFDIEKFKKCLDDFNDLPWIKEAILKFGLYMTVSKFVSLIILMAELDISEKR